MAIETISYTIAAFVYLVFFAVLLTDKHRGRTKQLLLAATFASTLWSASIAVQTVIGTYHSISHFFEFVKNLVWLTFIVSMLATAYTYSLSVSNSRLGILR
ncbi:MAG: hypothetical protein KJO91_02605, partial [Gammaproteobacteria bacterium]|nr:hypothetical protein [Gammaproteobacteria bacterium]